jgi:hypothetical protein
MQTQTMQWKSCSLFFRCSSVPEEVHTIPIAMFALPGGGVTFSTYLVGGEFQTDPNQPSRLGLISAGISSTPWKVFMPLSLVTGLREHQAPPHRRGG